MNKKGESSGGLWLFFILLALIPMCSHAGETSYDDCKKDCIHLNYNTNDINYTKKYYNNSIEISEEEVNKYCYNQCKGGGLE